VKWIAIFRLVLPDALFRLCGGRVENLGDLQPLAVKAGVNGVMMGNFLTTLGNTPEEDRKMFDDLGLDVSRQPDNGSNPRPDNRSGWLEGESPNLVESYISEAAWEEGRAERGLAEGDTPSVPLVTGAGKKVLVGAAVQSDGPGDVQHEPDLGVRLWDPTKQLSYKKRATPSSGSCWASPGPSLCTAAPTSTFSPAPVTSGTLGVSPWARPRSARPASQLASEM
jgi:hypothetical protein